jgi:hypothetical protein
MLLTDTTTPHRLAYLYAIKWNLYTVQIKTVSFKFNGGAEPWRIQDSGQWQYS